MCGLIKLERGNKGFYSCELSIEEVEIFKSCLRSFYGIGAGPVHLDLLHSSLSFCRICCCC